MKIRTILIFLFHPVGLKAQTKVIGHYRDYFGSQIQLNNDNTFKYTWDFDLGSSWTKGIWNIKNDTAFFYTILIYDTVRLIRTGDGYVDSLVLSANENPERISSKQYVGNLLSGGGQNRMIPPDKLFFKEGRLYEIRKGKKVVKKRKGFCTGKNRNPWYFKSNN